MNDRKILYLVISGVLLLLLIIGSFRYNRVVKELNKLKIETIEKIDSLVYANQEHEKQINIYKLEVETLEQEIDSLQKIKNKVLIQKDKVVVSKSASDGVEQLKKNLAKWEN